MCCCFHTSYFFPLSLIGIESSTACQSCRYYFGISIDFIGIYMFDWGLAGACDAEGMPSCLYSVICRFVITTIDRDASTNFFHHRCTSRLLGPYNRLCTIHSAPVTSTVEFYAHLFRATGLLACYHVASSGHITTACISFTVASISLSLMHRRLCYTIFVMPFVYTGLCPTDWVFVIEPALPMLSLSPAAGHPLAWPLSLLANASAFALLLLRPAQPYHQHHHLVPSTSSTPTTVPSTPLLPT